MDEIQALANAWWAGLDGFAHMAILAGASFLATMIAFMLFGQYTNPSRRHPNEDLYRQFSGLPVAYQSRGAGYDAEASDEDAGDTIMWPEPPRHR
jgi:hypothetical protein